MRNIKQLIIALLFGEPAKGDRIYERPVRPAEERPFDINGFRNWLQYNGMYNQLKYYT